MRSRYPSTQRGGHILITEVSIRQNSRHQLPPTLFALQYLYGIESVRESVLDHLSTRLIRGRNTHGRKGLSLWEILVLGVVRLSEDRDYDSLCDLANEHYTLRGILGVLPSDGKMGDVVYKVSTIKDTVGQLDEATLMEINTLVVKAGHELIGKKKGNGSRFAPRFTS